MTTQKLFDVQTEDCREASMTVDFTVRQGTANVYSKAAQFRAVWTGVASTSATLFLEPEQAQAVSGPFDVVILNSEYPVTVTYFDPATSAIVNETVNQVWFHTQAVESLTVKNNSTTDKNAVAVMAITKAKEV